MFQNRQKSKRNIRCLWDFVEKCWMLTMLRCLVRMKVICMVFKCIQLQMKMLAIRHTLSVCLILLKV